MSEACMNISLAAGTSSTTSCRQCYHVTTVRDSLISQLELGSFLSQDSRQYLCHSNSLGALPREEEGSVRLEICELRLCGHL